eukprot:355014-Chlamydomonas_euryale.AAC.2
MSTATQCVAATSGAAHTHPHSKLPPATSSSPDAINPPNPADSFATVSDAHVCKVRRKCGRPQGATPLTRAAPAARPPPGAAATLPRARVPSRECPQAGPAGTPCARRSVTRAARCDQSSAV